jgi:valyl-tRNA synthetase
MCGATSRGTPRQSRRRNAPAVTVLGTLYLDLAKHRRCGAPRKCVSPRNSTSSRNTSRAREARLSNEAFVSKAPPAVLEGARKQLADQKAKRTEIE